MDRGTDNENENHEDDDDSLDGVNDEEQAAEGNKENNKLETADFEPASSTHRIRSE